MAISAGFCDRQSTDICKAAGQPCVCTFRNSWFFLCWCSNRLSPFLMTTYQKSSYVFFLATSRGLEVRCCLTMSKNNQMFEFAQTDCSYCDMFMTPLETSQWVTPKSCIWMRFTVQPTKSYQLEHIKNRDCSRSVVYPRIRLLLHRL